MGKMELHGRGAAHLKLAVYHLLPKLGILNIEPYTDPPPNTLSPPFKGGLSVLGVALREDQCIGSGMKGIC